VTLSEPVDYAPARRDDVRALMGEVFGSVAGAEEFDWWHERNPAGSRVFSIVLDGERVAGASGMSFHRMALGGEEHEVAFALDAATHPDYRGRGLWSALELRNEEECARLGAPAVLGFTNPMAGPILVGKLGWRDLAWLRFWARPVLRRSGRLPRRVEVLERFAPDVDELYREARAGWPNHVVRRAVHLNWRYAESPRGYRILAARGTGGRLDGYAVVGHKRYEGIDVGVLADLVVRPGAVRAGRALVRAAARSVARGRVLVGLLPAAGPARTAFLASGFLPTHRSIRFIGKPLQDGVELPEERAGWHVSLGDMDIF
jgi:GNAT superfamily N-acetyltransferase